VKTVLIVEDSITAREMLRRSLEKDGGYNVIEAPNGSIAYNLLAGKKPQIDAAVLDIMMQGHGGTVRDYLLKTPQYKDVIVIFYTSLDREQVDARVLEGALYVKKEENTQNCR
jgi:CheY-like chemotaxis protein